MLDVSDITSLSGSTASGSEEEQETQLGTIFADRGEGGYLVTYIKRPAKEYFKCVLSECPDTMQIHLLMAMNSGRATEALNLSWDDNRSELTRITEEEYVKAKRKGVKPVREWSDRRIETLRSKLDIINLVGTTATPPVVTVNSTVQEPLGTIESKPHQLYTIQDTTNVRKNRYTPSKFGGFTKNRTQTESDTYNRNNSRDRVKPRSQDLSADRARNEKEVVRSRRDLFERQKAESNNRRELTNLGTRGQEGTRTQSGNSTERTYKEGNRQCSDERDRVYKGAYKKKQYRGQHLPTKQLA